MNTLTLIIDLLIIISEVKYKGKKSYTKQYELLK